MKHSYLLWLYLLLNCSSACSPVAGAAGDSSFVTVPDAFPVSHYTPHGYIDNPYHSMIVNRSGVIRSVPPLGFGFWRDTFKGAYGSGDRGPVNYLSLLNFSFRIDGRNFITAGDFKRHGADLYSAYHSKQMMSYDWKSEQLSCSIKYFLPREHTLAAVVELENTGETVKHVTAHAIHVYKIGDAKWWGSNGIAASYDSTNDLAVAKVWAYGDVFVMGSELKSAGHTAAVTETQADDWIRSLDPVSVRSGSVNGETPVRNILRYEVVLQPHAKKTFLVCLSRGTNEAWAKEEFRSAGRISRTALAGQLRADEVFWRQCPVLEGDWNDHWKRGWVYDFETLRMNVRRPLGIFKHPWDAMQVHSPRVVLGETAFDMMTLSYADPELAKDVIYGTFADALAPNIPCVREDGSMNMISSDGSECGTAPMWGYPFLMIRNIFAATNDRQWLAQLYPSLQAYIEWWLKHRTDAEGWLHCNNSWESGQDGSRRFLVAEHNEAAVADFVRTVDVEASMAEAMQSMQYFAGVLGKNADGEKWATLSRQRIQNTRSMFDGQWFRDVDARTKKPIILEDNYDVAMLAPLTCKVASQEQIDAIRPLLKRFHNGHEWPPGLFTLAEAAWNAGERALAADGVARTADRVYGRTDSGGVMFYDSAFSYRVPGVANEFWPEKMMPAGGENYGWGATLPMNIIRTIIGFREKENPDSAEFYLAPAFPKKFLVKGKVYTIRNMQYRGFRFDISYTVDTPASLLARVTFHAEKPGVVSVTTPAGTTIASQKTTPLNSSLSFRVDNNTIVTVSVN